MVRAIQDAVKCFAPDCISPEHAHRLNPTEMARLIEAYGMGELHEVKKGMVIVPKCFAEYLRTNRPGRKVSVP